MKTFVFGILASLSCLESLAACPAVDAIVKEYGISYWGFQKHIPRAGEPAKIGWSSGTVLSVPIQAPEHVHDAFAHEIVLNMQTKEALVLRTGGLAGVTEWYGPISLAGSESGVDLCNSAKLSSMARNTDR